MNCCNSQEDKHGFNRIFRGSYVEREKRKFLNHGVDKRQQAFLNNVQGSSLLDIGCGVGAIALTALQQGASRAHLLDVSRSYLEAAKQTAVSLNLQTKTHFLEGDFVTLDVPPADIITLDRVICCYPEAERLLKKAAKLSQQELIFTYPKPYWFMKLGKSILNRVMKLRKNPYQFYLHKEQHLLDVATANGHKLSQQESFGIWKFVHFTK